MSAAFEAFDLNVLVGAGRQLWISARSRLGAVYAVPQTPDQEAWDVLAEASATVDDAVRFAEHDPDAVHAIGEALRDILFGDPDVLALFQRSRGAAADQGRPLLVGVLGAPDIVAGLPWELTLDPEGGPHDFLTLSPDAHVLRLPRTRTYPVSSRPIAPPLNLLLVLSSPTPSASGEALPFDLYEEKQSILDELAPLIAEGRLVVDVEDRPSVENLRRRVGGRARGYHVVHYLGHARETELVLENRLGGVRNVDATAFVRVLQSSPDLRLVVYTGCLTARQPDAEDAQGDGARRSWHDRLSIADLSVRIAAPAVVGMQAVLPFRTERIFARFFYRALASGRSLPDAVQLGRAAIGSDEFVGELLDWSVPALFVGGQDPGPLLDPTMPPGEVQRAPRVELKLGLEEEERSTFARPVALREAVNVLSGRRSNRALVVTGSAELRIPFVGRVLDDLGDEVSVVLYAPSAELTAEEDPVLVLCRYVAELLTRVDARARDRPEGWTGMQWWSRLVEEVVTCPAVIAIDDVDELTPEATAAIGAALRRLTLRRTRTHLVLAGATVPAALLGDRAVRYALPITLRPLEWTELWPWVRRNLPELNRSDPEALRECYEAGLQDDLVLWTRLAETFAARRDSDPRQLVASVLAANPRPLRRPAAPVLRAALTNPDVTGKVRQFAEWMTALAGDHDVGGRVSDPSRTSEGAPVAELLELTTPFDETGSSTTERILAWLDEVRARGVDVVLLDFGSEQESAVWAGICADLAREDVLVIAAGGNSGDAGPQYPAWYEDVLAVGPLDSSGTPTAYASWNPGRGKPELFAPEDLSWTRHADFVPAGVRGSSYSSLGAMAAAILVWSVDRSRSAAEVRRVLVETARSGSVDRGSGPWEFRALDIDAALRRMRETVILDAARRAPSSRRELLAATGLSAGIALPIIDDLAARGVLRPVADDDVERLGVSRDEMAAPSR